MTGRGRGGLGFGRGPFRPCLAGLLLRFEPGGRSMPGLEFLLGTAPRFPRFLPFSGYARQRGSFGRLLGTQPLVRQIRRTPLGVSPFAGQAGELLFLACPGSSSRRQLGSGKFAALGIGERALFRLDFRAQRDFSQTFDMRLLRGGRLGCGLGRGTAQGLLRRKFVCLQTALGRRCLLGSLGLTRFCSGPGAFVRGGTRESLCFGSAFGVGLISGGHTVRGELAALPLQIHQSRQDFAQGLLPVPGKACFPDRDSLTQTRQGPKVE